MGINWHKHTHVNPPPYTRHSTLTLTILSPPLLASTIDSVRVRDVESGGHVFLCWVSGPVIALLHQFFFTAAGDYPRSREREREKRKWHYSTATNLSPILQHTKSTLPTNTSTIRHRDPLFGGTFSHTHTKAIHAFGRTVGRV